MHTWRSRGRTGVEGKKGRGEINEGEREVGVQGTGDHLSP